MIPSAKYFYNKLFQNNNQSLNTVFMGFDMSGSMFDNQNRNWKIQTAAIMDYFEKSGLKNIQAFGWSSDNDKNLGVVQCPLFISKIFISQYMNQFHSGRMTEPSTFFVCLLNYLQSNKISADKDFHVVFFTDGVICTPVGNSVDNEKKKLYDAISALKSNYRKASIEIHIIDPDFSPQNTEELKIGKDVFNVAMEFASNEKSTEYKIITRVIVHTNETTSYTELNQLKTVNSSMLPFDGKVFLKSDISLFEEWFSMEIKDNAKSEDNLCNLLLKLAETISYLVEYMVPEQIEKTIQTYSNFFIDTNVGFDAASMLIRNICEQAQLNRTFMKKDISLLMHRFFENCIKELKVNAHKALGLDKTISWTSLPINSIVFYGENANVVSTDIDINGSKYAKCGATIGYSNVIPIIPIYESIDPIASQCFRLYIRACLAQWIKEKYDVKIDPTSDEMLYVFGSIMVGVVLSNVPDLVKNAYKHCFKIMLMKKLSRSTFVTVLQNLLDGNSPIDFKNKIKIALLMMGLEASDDTSFWYAICEASGIPGLASAQKSDMSHLENIKNKCKSDLINLVDTNVMHQIYSDKIVPVNNCNKQSLVPKKLITENVHMTKLLVCFRVSVSDQEINHFIDLANGELSNIVVGTGINIFNLPQFMNDIDSNNKIVILPDKDIKPNNIDTYKSIGYEPLRIISGTSATQMLDLVKDFFRKT